MFVPPRDAAGPVGEASSLFLAAPVFSDRTAFLSVDGLSYAVDHRVLLADVSLSLDAEAITMILGPNGAGKSLFLRLCDGLLTPSAGTLRWSAETPRIAMVFQAPVMLRRSVRGNVAYALKHRGVPLSRRRVAADAVLRRAGIAHLADRPARQLSGGEKQRVAIARAWAMEPDVLLLDEPTAALDPTSTRAVEALVAEIHASGTKIVMTTHDLAQARRLADDVVLLHHGRLCEHTPADAFFAAPRSEEGRRFLRGDLLA